MSEKPVDKANPPETASGYQKQNFVEIGNQVGFDPKRMGKLWQALSSFLHVSLPESKSDKVETYGEIRKISNKIGEALSELKNLQNGTMVSSGIGSQVEFDCYCGRRNKRKEKLLSDGKIFNCVNPSCKERWRAHLNEGSFEFESVTIGVKCESCGDETLFPERWLLEMDRKGIADFDCKCGHKNYVRWQLVQVKPVMPTEMPLSDS